MDFMENEAEESNPSSAEEELSDGELRPQIKKGKERKKCTIQISDDEEEDEEEDPEAIAEEMKDFINEDVEEEEDAADVSKEDEKKRKGDSDEDDQLDDVDYDLIDDNLGIKVNRKSSSNACHSLKEVFEPSELERGHFTDAYNAIRLADFPDGFQLRRIPVKEADDAELEEEADWIYKQAFATLCISQQTFLDNDHLGAANNFNRRTPNAMTSKIKQALGFMRNHRQEVPFIAFYRKEYVEPELNFHDLGKVYHWDEKWMQLCTRRSNLTRLFEKMKEHLYKRYSDPDKPAVLFRPITDEEIERVKNVQTPEELRDVYQNFLFYYGHEIPNMRNSEQSRPREEGEADSEPKPKGSSMKQAQRQSGYSVCLAAKLMPNSRNMYSLSSNLSDIDTITTEYQRMRADFYSLFLKNAPGICSTRLKLISCTKSPNHSDYYSLDSLTLDCLPIGYQSVDLIYLIKSLFDLTVMVEVESKSSMGREDNFFWQGSGKVEKIDLFNGTPCKCTLCITSSSPSHDWGEITISTSANLTSGNFEARHYLSYFFYDNYNNLENIKYLAGNRLTSLDTILNITKFVCTTCDVTLLRRLSAAIKQFDEAYNKCVTIPEEKDKLVIVVAHPHACIKHVTFSRCHIVDNIYNEIACPGLSGAYILSLKGRKILETKDNSEEYRTRSFEEVHDICVKSKKGPSEQELMTIICAGQSHHDKFVDLSTDLKPFLPPCYQHDEMVNLIRAVADLTVMVEAKCMEVSVNSVNEPSGDSKEKETCLEEDTSTVYHQGTGKVVSVLVYTEKKDFCKCHLCKGSKSPSQEWAEICILTSASLFHRTSSAQEVSCTLFFGDNNQGEREILYGDRIEVKNVKRDVCKFICICCNLKLADKLCNLLQKYSENKIRAYSRYVDTVKCEKERLVVLVSHPHSCKKYVSFGKWAKDLPTKD